jgi:hypothetical protein
MYDKSKIKEEKRIAIVFNALHIIKIITPFLKGEPGKPGEQGLMVSISIYFFLY